MNFDIDFKKLASQDPDFAIYIAATTQAVIGRSIDDWIKYLYKSYQDGVTPEEVAAEVKANI